MDPETATALQKEFQAEAKSDTANSSKPSLKSEYWFTQFSDRRAIADQSAKIALSLIDTDPEKAIGLVVQSCQGGTVSGGVIDIVRKLAQNGDRASLDKIEMGIGRVLAANVTLDPSSLGNAAYLVLSDKDMSPEARGSFITFFMHSLQAWVIVVKDPGIDNKLYKFCFC